MPRTRAFCSHTGSPLGPTLGTLLCFDTRTISFAASPTWTAYLRGRYGFPPVQSTGLKRHSLVLLPATLGHRGHPQGQGIRGGVPGGPESRAGLTGFQGGSIGRQIILLALTVR